MKKIMTLENLFRNHSLLSAGMSPDLRAEFARHQKKAAKPMLFGLFLINLKSNISCEYGR